MLPVLRNSRHRREGPTATLICQPERMPEAEIPEFGQDADEWTASQPPADTLGAVRLRVFCRHSATSSAPVAEVRGDTILVGDRRYMLNASQVFGRRDVLRLTNVVRGVVPVDGARGMA